MKKILIVFGTRPEAIKMVPVVSALRQVKGFNIRVCVTGQHREMLDQVLELFELKPEYDLNIMQPNQSLIDVVSAILLKLRDVFLCWKPDLLIVHGDTATTFAASLCGFFEHVKVAHVEAGLRTGNNYSPWPEEVNRRLTGIIANFHFAPTEGARDNLLREGVQISNVFVTGNTVVDALLDTVHRIENNAALQAQLKSQFEFISNDKRLILVTGHRRENFGEGFEQMCQALVDISKRVDVQIIYPVHLNPNVREIVHQRLGSYPNIFLIEPVEYLAFVYLMSKSYLILTDSGGIQEEAPSLGKPVLVTRETTERPEAIDAGVAKLVGMDRKKITSEIYRLLDDSAAYQAMAKLQNPYGNGFSGQKIAKILSDHREKI